jgi:threonine dehydrogenase-like Zn-dependent dehydrogenase
MQATVLCDVGRMEVRSVPCPAPGPRDALVRVAAVGLCGTDFHIYAGHANYHTDARGRPIPFREAPQILGHEIAGVVEALGSEVRDLRPGDRVIVDQGINCVSAGRPVRCEYCASGDSHQCEAYQELGITGRPGGLAEFVCVPAVNVVPIASDLPAEEAVLAEPLGCILHASDVVRRATTRYRLDAADPARRVRAIMIAGAGPAGLLFTQHLRRIARFDGPLLVSEPNALRREQAAALGAEPLDPAQDDFIEIVRERTGGRGLEYVIDASGSAAVIAQLPALVRRQATVLLYSHGQSGFDFGVLNNLQYLEPALLSPVGASGGFDADGRPLTYRQALTLIEEGTIEVGPLITHRYRSLDSVPAAFAGDHHRPDYVKGVVVPG